MIENNIYFNNLVKILSGKGNNDSPQKTSFLAKGAKKCLDECLSEVDFRIKYQCLSHLRQRNEDVNSVLEALYGIRDARYIGNRELSYFRDDLNSLCESISQIYENPQNIDNVKDIKKVQIYLSKVGEMWHERLKEEYPNA